jgi:hypothetical protein
MKKFFLLISIFAILHAQAQLTFEKTYCFASYATAITSNYDSGYIVLCRENQSQNLLMRLNKYGDTIWAKPGFFLRDCEISNDTNIVTLNLSVNDDLMLTKLDQAGEKIWEKKIGRFTVAINDILKTPDSGYLLTGTFYDTNTLEYSAGFIKTDSFGDTLWTQRFSDGNVNTLEVGYFSIIGNDGNFYFCGTTYDYSVTFQPYTLLVGSLTPLGILRISKIFHNSIGNFTEYTAGICKLPLDGFMVCTTCDTNGNNDNAIRLYRFTNTCDTLWSRFIDSEGKKSDGYGMCITNDGNIMIAGDLMLESPSTIYQRAYMAKVDTSGTIIWDRQMSDYYSVFWSVCNTLDDGFAFWGGKKCEDKFYVCYLAKTDENGLVTGLEEHPTAQQKALYALEPNPLTDQNLVLSAYEGFGDGIQLELLSGNGQRVCHAAIGPQPGKKQLSIHLPALAKGLYLLRLRHQSQPSKNCALKLIVN